MKLFAVFLLALSLPGCAAMSASMMGPDDVRETVRLLQTQNAQGCATFRASGTPPASRIDLDAAIGWGDVDMVSCLEVLKANP